MKVPILLVVTFICLFLVGCTNQDVIQTSPTESISNLNLTSDETNLKSIADLEFGISDKLENFTNTTFIDLEISSGLSTVDYCNVNGDKHHKIIISLRQNESSYEWYVTGRGYTTTWNCLD